MSVAPPLSELTFLNLAYHGFSRKCRMNASEGDWGLGGCVPCCVCDVIYLWPSLSIELQDRSGARIRQLHLN